MVPEDIQGFCCLKFYNVLLTHALLFSSVTSWDNSVFWKGMDSVKSNLWLVKTILNLKRFHTYKYRSVINRYVAITCYLSDWLVGWALHRLLSNGASGLRSNKKLTLSDGLQESWYNSEEGFKKVKVVFSMIGLPQREFWGWSQLMLVWLYDPSIMPEKKLFWSISCICIRKWDFWIITALDMSIVKIVG